MLFSDSKTAAKLTQNAVKITDASAFSCISGSGRREPQKISEIELFLLIVCGFRNSFWTIQTSPPSFTFV
ncbi:MAG: hypothetical protein C0424_11405 [Sphingobacteriaceae bacterium]|nr:hypothetical protein [Sphingobacteriaceae bacterium]